MANNTKQRGPQFTRTVPKFLQQYSHMLNVNKKNYMNEEVGGYDSEEDRREAEKIFNSRSKKPEDDEEEDEPTTAVGKRSHDQTKETKTKPKEGSDESDEEILSKFSRPSKKVKVVVDDVETPYESIKKDEKLVFQRKQKDRETNVKEDKGIATKTQAKGIKPNKALLSFGDEE